MRKHFFMQPFGSTLPLPPLPKTSPYNQILDNLYLGGIQSSEKNWNDFRLIVNCSKDIPFQSHRFGMDSPECIRIPISDTPDECENFLEYIFETNVLRRMNQAISEGKPVLVHCYAGAQRSCALIACYLIEFCFVPPEVAMQHIRKCRPIAFFGGANFMSAIRRFHTKMNWRLAP
jgi:Dual specificity phosphatase, catalytic domain